MYLQFRSYSLTLINSKAYWFTRTLFPLRASWTITLPLSSSKPSILPYESLQKNLNMSEK